MLIGLTERIHDDGLELLRSKADIGIASELEPESANALLASADAVIVRSTLVTSTHLDRWKRAKVIGRHGVGLENICVDEARVRGIEVVNTPRSNTAAVAEYCLAAMLALSRRLAEGRALLAQGTFVDGVSLPGQVQQLGLLGRSLTGRRLGIIGAGAIGRTFGALANGVGMNVSAYDPFIDDASIEDLGFEPRSSLAELLLESDVVSVHVPGGQGPVIGEAELVLLAPHAIVINASRGECVDVHAVVAQIFANRLGGAAIDVFVTEPPRLPPSYFDDPRLLLTPHMAAMTDEAIRRMAVDVATNVLSVLENHSHPARPNIESDVE